MKLTKEEFKVRCSAQTEWIKDYARETSIIILGLCITYYGDSLVDGYKEKQDDIESMRMIYQELREGIDQMQTIRKYYQYEGEMASLILGNHSSGFKDIREDSVSIYYNQIRMFHIWSYEGYAFNILRNSTSMQRIDRKLLLKLFNCYDYIETLEALNADYKDQRLEQLLKYRAKVRNIETTTIGQWRQCCTYTPFFEYLTQTVPLLSQISLSTCTYAITLTEQTLEMIADQYPEAVPVRCEPPQPQK